MQARTHNRRRNICRLDSVTVQLRVVDFQLVLVVLEASVRVVEHELVRVVGHEYTTPRLDGKLGGKQVNVVLVKALK